MVGLGETMDEVKEVMRDLRRWGVDILTIGQYLQPSRQHLPIARYYTLEEFAELKDFGLEIGFRGWRAPRWCAPPTTPPSRCARSAPCIRNCTAHKHPPTHFRPLFW